MNISLELWITLLVCVTLYIQSAHVALARVVTVYRTDAGKQYLIDTSDECNWYEAWVQCSQYGNQLVVLDTRAKNLLLQTILEENALQFNKLWISGKTQTLKDKEHVTEMEHFSWYPSEQQFSYTQWDENHPALSTSTQEQCVYTAGNTSPPYGWRSGPCQDMKNGFICEESDDSSLQKMQRLIALNGQDLQININHTRVWKEIIRRAGRNTQIKILYK